MSQPLLPHILFVFAQCCMTHLTGWYMLFSHPLLMFFSRMWKKVACIGCLSFGARTILLSKSMSSKIFTESDCCNNVRLNTFCNVETSDENWQNFAILMKQICWAIHEAAWLKHHEALFGASTEYLNKKFKGSKRNIWKHCESFRGHLQRCITHIRFPLCEKWEKEGEAFAKHTWSLCA